MKAKDNSIQTKGWKRRLEVNLLTSSSLPNACISNESTEQQYSKERMEVQIGCKIGPLPDLSLSNYHKPFFSEM